MNPWTALTEPQVPQWSGASQVRRPLDEREIPELPKPKPARTLDSDERDGCEVALSHRVWLHILRHGPCTLRDITPHLRGVSDLRVRQTLTDMHDSGYISRTKVEGATKNVPRYRYSVTAECKPPRWMTMGKIWGMTE